MSTDPLVSSLALQPVFPWSPRITQFPALMLVKPIFVHTTALSGSGMPRVSGGRITLAFSVGRSQCLS